MEPVTLWPTTQPRHIALNGDLGSGKSAVARILAQDYGFEYVSTGDVHRRIAVSRGLSTLEANLVAESDDSIDRDVDRVTQELSGSSRPHVFDSRMAWRFVAAALKVRLIVRPEIAATRVQHRGAAAEDVYATSAAAHEALEQRYESERRRFMVKYGVDVSHLRNYHVVIDTSRCSAHEVAQLIKDRYHSSVQGAPELWVEPETLIDLPDLRDSHPGGAGTVTTTGVPMVYARPFFVALQTGGATGPSSGDGLTRGRLVAEALEVIGTWGTAQDLVDLAQSRASTTAPE